MAGAVASEGEDKNIGDVLRYEKAMRHAPHVRRFQHLRQTVSSHSFQSLYSIVAKLRKRSRILDLCIERSGQYRP